MAQPSVACYFNTRKRGAVEDTKINQARKVLLLDSSSVNSEKQGLGSPQTKIAISSDINAKYEATASKLQDKEEKILANKIASNPIALVSKNTRKTVRGTRSRKLKEPSNNKDIKELLTNIKKKETVTKQPPVETIVRETQIQADSPMQTAHKVIQKTPVDNQKDVEKQLHVTPPSTPKKKVNIKSRSALLNELRASINRFNEGANKLKEVEKKTTQIQESPKLKAFKQIELEVETSPQKIFSPEKAYLSPKKDSSARRNLFSTLSPTKNAVALPQSPSKRALEEISKPGLTLPFKYRYLAEMFRCIDTVVQILFNRKETITFRKLKPAVEELLKRNLLERHFAQIKTVFPGAFNLQQEKLKMFGAGMKNEKWELVVKPNINDEHMTSEILLHRRRKLFNTLLDKVKGYHDEFLQTLDPPMVVDKDKITRWHPEFDIEKVPDIELSEIPKPPIEEKLTTGKDVLEKARVLFNCNQRMEQALQRLKEARANLSPSSTEESTSGETPSSILKGIPKGLLEKVRQKQAAKALVSMTRSEGKEKEVQVYSRLPELARLTRNVFVAEKKSVLQLDVVVDKLLKCYRGNLTNKESEDHLRIISKEVPGWLRFHEIRNCVYIKLAKDADLSLVLSKLEDVAKQKRESF